MMKQVIQMVIFNDWNSLSIQPPTSLGAYYFPGGKHWNCLCDAGGLAGNLQNGILE